MTLVDLLPSLRSSLNPQLEAGNQRSTRAVSEMVSLDRQNHVKVMQDANFEFHRLGPDMR